MSTRLRGKVAIITGGGSGIGRAVASAFASEGAQVVVGDITGQQDSVAGEIGAGVLPLRADVTSTADVEHLVRTAVSTFGKLDVFVNNAGISSEVAPTGEASVENFD